MSERVFLGWDRPFLIEAVDWLLGRRDELPEMLVIVPTAQSGRRLRESLAAQGGALLAPRVATPGSLLQSCDSDAAPEWIERIAWMEILESVRDWAAYDALFPEPLREHADWSHELAKEFIGLRRALQENGLMLSSAGKKLRDSLEAERWDALARLEDLVEKKLHSWELKSRSRLLADFLPPPGGAKRIVLAGVTELPPLIARSLSVWGIPVIALIGAPATDESHFSALGIPDGSWSTRSHPAPSGSLVVVADPRQQAAEAHRIIAQTGTASDAVALGAADSEVGEALAQIFTAAGWTAFHPAAPIVPSGLVRWLKIWSQWMSTPSLSHLADLLTLPETGLLVAGNRAQKSKTLATLRDRWMITSTDDLRRRLRSANFRTEYEQADAEALLAASEALERWRDRLLGENFHASLVQLFEKFSSSGPITAEATTLLLDWWYDAAPFMRRVKRGARFWIDLMLSEASSPTPLPPDGRVIDVQGWLEIFHEPGGHLVLTGMNEGKVPSRMGGEPWLNESIRKWLGLVCDSDRAGRDSFLYHAMLEARRAEGRVDVICGKAGSGGETYLPSRVLLETTSEMLPARVKSLFRDVQPSEAGLHWQADWQWQPRLLPPPSRLSVTSLAIWLTCPFRYYLKHVVRMQTPETERAEWNARDFGNVAHEVLERWGRDTEARLSSDAAAIGAWLSAELDRVVGEWFGESIPLSVRIQTESLRQRLRWLAKIQATTRAEGWEIIDVERKIELQFGNTSIVAKIDRIDRHSDTGHLRVIDYKTGAIEGVDKSHRKRVTASTQIPRHLPADCPAIYAVEQNGKSDNFLWQNLQLPLYASALVQAADPLPTPCYFELGKTESAVNLHEWSDFDHADLEAAEACTTWITEQIAASNFWPPAENVNYDDFAILSAGRTLEEMVHR